MDKIIFWDFQGTLAHNDWMFSKALYRVLIKNDDKTEISIDDIKKKPMKGFPWQDYDKEYIHLTDSSAWWKNADNIFLECYKSLGLQPYIVECISSANVGYEKTNPKIYKYALERYKYPREVWMIGDSIIADVRGAENVGIKGVLVRSKREDNIKYYSSDLKGLREIIV